MSSVKVSELLTCFICGDVIHIILDYIGIVSFYSSQRSLQEEIYIINHTPLPPELVDIIGVFLFGDNYLNFYLCQQKSETIIVDNDLLVEVGRKMTPGRIEITYHSFDTGSIIIYNSGKYVSMFTDDDLVGVWGTKKFYPEVNESLLRHESAYSLEGNGIFFMTIGKACYPNEYEDDEKYEG